MSLPLDREAILDEVVLAEHHGIHHPPTPAADEAETPQADSRHQVWTVHLHLLAPLDVVATEGTEEATAEVTGTDTFRPPSKPDQRQIWQCRKTVTKLLFRL
jgi:hypothetical protein